MTFTYTLDGSLYLNITNQCDCACSFCIRGENDGVGDGENLWLPRDPIAAEVIEDIKKRDLSMYREVVFCGYGEPTENLDVLLEVCRFLKSLVPAPRIRLNTNGLCELSHEKPVAPLLEGLVDAISISLNAPDSARYLEITKPAFGEDAFGAMLRFAKSVKKYVPDVTLTVVDILTKEEIAACHRIASDLDIPLRVREKI